MELLRMPPPLTMHNWQATFDVMKELVRGNISLNRSTRDFVFVDFDNEKFIDNNLIALIAYAANKQSVDAYFYEAWIGSTHNQLIKFVEQTEDYPFGRINHCWGIDRHAVYSNLGFVGTLGELFFARIMLANCDLIGEFDIEIESKTFNYSRFDIEIGDNHKQGK